MKKITFLVFMLFFIGINVSIKAQSYVPLVISSGWNGDLIANGSNTSALATTSESFDNGGMVYYSTDFSSSGTHGSNPPCSNSGIPADITSGNGPVYHIASFVGQTLILEPGGGSGTLVFSNPGSFDHLSLLAASAVSPSYTATLNVQVNFSDATNYTTTFIVGDWYSGTSNIAISGLGRINRTGDVWDECGLLKLFDCIINLSAYKSKVVTSIHCWNSDPDQRCGVFAVCGVTASGAPDAIIADAATIITSTSFQANWHWDGQGVAPTSYVLDVSTDPNFGSFVGGFNNFNVGFVTTYPVPSLTPGTTYYYRVRGVNTNGQGPNSNVITVTTPHNVPQAVIADPATSVFATSFQSHWHPASGDPHPPTSYVLDVSTDINFGSFVGIFNNYNVGGVTTYPVPGLTPGGTYYYRVRGVNTDGQGPNSNVITVLLPTLPVATASVVSNVNCYGYSNGSVTVSVSGGTTPFTYHWSTSPVQTTQTATGLPAGTYWVTVTDAGSFTSASSATVTQPAQWWPGLSGQTPLCQNSAGNVYQTESGMTNYVWTVSAGGTITNGGTSTDHSATITWGGSGAQFVSVKYTNGSGCTAFAPAVYNVTVNPAPTPVISGATTVTFGQTVTYSTPYITGHSYSWNVSLGNVVQCPDPNCITVTWYFPCGIINPNFVTVTETIQSTGCSTTVTRLITVTQ